MKDFLDKAIAAIEKIEKRVGHYLTSRSAIPSDAVAPGLAEELQEAKDAIAQAQKLADVPAGLAEKYTKDAMAAKDAMIADLQTKFAATEKELADFKASKTDDHK